MSQEWPRTSRETNEQKAEIALPSQEERKAKLSTPEGQALKKANSDVAHSYELLEDPRYFFRRIFEALNYGEYRGEKRKVLIAFKNFLESLSDAEKNLPAKADAERDVPFSMVLREVNNLLQSSVGEKVSESPGSNLQERKVGDNEQEENLEDKESDYYLTRLNLDWENLDSRQFPDGYKDGGRMWKALLNYAHEKSTTDQFIPVQSLPGNGFSTTSFKFAEQYDYRNLTCEGGAEKLRNDIQEVPNGSIVVIDEGMILTAQDEHSRREFNIIVKAIKEKELKVLLHVRPNERFTEIAKMFQEEGIRVSAPFEFGYRPDDMEYAKEQLDESRGNTPNYNAVTFRELEGFLVSAIWENLSKEAQELVIKIGKAEEEGKTLSFDSLSAREKMVFDKFDRFGVFRRSFNGSMFIRDKALYRYGKEEKGF